VSALRQLVKQPWSDGWELGRKLALDLVEEAKQQGLKQGFSVDQIRQLPTKFQLANSRNSHVRKWFDREPTLAKKFLRAAGLICSKSNGTFVREHIRSLADLPALIRKADPSRFVECDKSESGDEGEGSLTPSSSAPPSPVDVVSFPSSPTQAYHPKLKVCYHMDESNIRKDRSDQPFLFKVPINDLGTMEELHSRLNGLLQEMGTQHSEKKLILRVSPVNSEGGAAKDCESLDELARCHLLHVHVQ